MFISDYTCICKSGFTGEKCEVDIDECVSNPCQHSCKNTKGSFKCHCDDGYQLKNDYECNDIDECLNSTCGQNGVCVNMPGTFRCECNEGFLFDEASQSCLKISPECQLECSHACGPDGECICPKGYILNTVNNVECIKKRREKKKDRKTKKKKVLGCPVYNATEGMQLTYTKGFDQAIQLYPRSTTVKGKCMDGYKSSSGGKLRLRCKKDGSWKGHESLSCKLITCPAIEELEPGVVVKPESCGLENSLVKQKCQFLCKDSDNYKLIGTKVARCRKTGLWKQKGGPPKCVEKRKKKKGKKKGKKSKNKSLGHPLKPQETFTTTTKSTTTVITVTNTPEKEITLSTTRPPWPTTIPWAQTWSPSTTTLPTTTTTILTTLKTTKPPYKHVAPIAPFAPVTSTMSSSSNFPSPFIYCPPDVVKDLPLISPNVSAQTVYIRIPQPKTNVNWYDYVKSYPPWAKDLEVELGLGRTLVTFTATSPMSNEVASCSFTIHVRDIVAPRVYNCPNDFDVYLEEGQIEKQVFWEEPIFADNVKIAHVMASKLPGYKMKAGRHDVLYQAADSDGNKARCVFTVTVWDSTRVHRQERR